MFRAAFAATLGYVLASLLVALMLAAALFVIAGYGWPLMEREVQARFDASHAAWCAEQERADPGATQITCP